MMNSKLILGTVQMGLPYGVNNNTGKIPTDQSRAILNEAFQSGIRFLDTAEVYGDAHSVIGDFHRNNPDQIFKVITKIPAGESFKDFEIKFKKYLDDLHVEQLEALMFHSYSSYIKNKINLPQLLGMRKDNLFRQIGVSVYTNSEFEELIEDDTIDLIQLPFNLLDNASLRGELLKHAKRRNKTIHTRSVFLQGLFFKDPGQDHPIASKLKDQLLKIQMLAKEKNVSIAALALSYCLQQKNIDQVLIGVDSIEQLKMNIEESKYEIDPQTIERIEQIKTENTDFLNPALWN